ncbi:menaquinone-dependent protoporphyrinogen IX oxidase [Anaerobacterium chartisolvens]|uniref:Menaquinone-dependent protoporphyrinogen IX oxidase n=1 Tax=Anaerobacterium chartisolvens TaxID=1297424 RepID=A0A369BFP5_9FIRM|nr:flavodoxin domain-containing protein [Anaerobacterium chartisolvens]RCX19297.1 menaquinone-dependent protoporphyrinogen IX oxidase [Anaerobacterium chartisolvens]
MDKVIIIHKSNTGFTEKYANWIAEDLNCRAVSVEKISLSEVAQYETVVFGGGIHAGAINGIRFIKNNLSLLHNKKIIVFATGATAPIPEEIERFRTANIPTNANIEFFYFQSGLNYENMRGMDKMLMGLLKTFLKLKKNKSDVEQGTQNAIQSSYDCSNRIQIEPLINFVRQSNA